LLLLFSEAYGLTIRRAIGFKSPGLAQGFPNHDDGTKAIIWAGPAELLNTLLIWLRQVHIIALLIVPTWNDHIWFKSCEEIATHRFLFPVVTPQWQGSFGVTAFILDTRYESRSSDLIKISLLSHEQFATKQCSPKQCLALQPCTFLLRRP